MNAPMTVSGTLPDGTKHVVTLTQTGPDTATIDDEAWALGASAAHQQVYKISGVRRTGDAVAASLRIGWFNVGVAFTLFADHVQLAAPGHNMAYPVTADEHAEAEVFIAGFPNA